MSCSRTQCSDAGVAQTRGLSSRVKHSTTELTFDMSVANTIVYKEAVFVLSTVSGKSLMQAKHSKWP